MISVKVESGRLIVSLGRKSKAMSAVVKSIMTDAVPRGEADAKGIVLEKIYSRAENERFPRSYNLLNSVSTKFAEEDGLPTFTLFLDPSKATAPYNYSGNRDTSIFSGLKSYSGPQNYYPEYVTQGNFFGKHISGTDFHQEWKNRVAGPLVIKLIEAIKGVI